MKIDISLAIQNHYMREIIKKYRKTTLFVVIGAAIGFAYWRFVGCSSGTCPLTANWHTSTVMGGLIGMLAVSSGRKPDKSDSGEGNTADIPGKPEFKEQTKN